MRFVTRLRAYAHHDDPQTAACNSIALLVASSQPLYPLYVNWLVGGDWQVACLTWLSTPFFLAVPWLARRSSLAGRALLPLAGIANGILATKAFGEASGVELFLLPCLMIAGMAFRKDERLAILGLIASTTAAFLVLHGRYGAALGRFDAAQYASFLRFNSYSVATLCAFTAYRFGNAFAALSAKSGFAALSAASGVASPDSRPSPPSPSATSPR